MVKPFSFSNASILSILICFNVTKLLIPILVILSALLINVKIKTNHYSFLA
nr:MAG TPA: hypothetical protein [Caudoviricetes sp.]